MQRRNRNTVDDEEILVENEQPTATLDNDFGGVSVSEAIENVVTNLTAAALPQQDDYLTVDLSNRQVLVSEAPPDAYNFTYIVFYLLGIATMTPWNFFITAEDYWVFKFRNATINDTDANFEPELTPMQKSFTCDLTLTASISGTTFLILNAIYGQHVSLRLKMVGTLSVILAIFIVTTAFVEVNTDRWQEQFFLITLLTVIIINVCSATMSGGLFGIAGLFPSEYMTAVVSGQALGGVMTALAFILVLAFGAPPNVTAFIYFIIGSVVILLSIVAYVIMSHRAFFKYYLEGGDKYAILTATPTHSRAVADSVPLEPNLREVCGKIYVEAVGILLLFATTLSVYPAVTVLMQSQNFGHGSTWSDVYYMPVVNYLFFNTGDYFGRILAGIFEKPRDNPHTALLLIFIRVLYVPFFLCSNTNLHVFLPTLVQTDVAFILMMATFALGNGYLANILLIMAPRSVEKHEKELASSIMAASLSCGLAFGSMLSMVFVQLL